MPARWFSLWSFFTQEAISTGTLCQKEQRDNVINIIPPFYRDIKPDNVLLDGDGYCYLADFNVSIKAETSKRKAGTAKYMGIDRADNHEVKVITEQ